MNGRRCTESDTERRKEISIASHRHQLQLELVRRGKLAAARCQDGETTYRASAKERMA